MKNIIYSFIILMCYHSNLSAQGVAISAAPVSVTAAEITYPEGDTLRVQLNAARIRRDHIILRWAPFNYTTWQYAHYNGFTLTRIPMTRDGKEIDPREAEEQTKVVEIIPIDQEHLQELANGTNSYWGIVYAAYHGNTFEATTGTPNNSVQLYNITKERENRYGFSLFACDQDLSVAKGLAFGYEDMEDVESNVSYLYILSPNGEPENLIKRNAIIVVEQEAIFQAPLLSKPKSKPGHKSVFLSCVLPKNNNPYVSYFVQRSTDGKAFSTRNTQPLINTNAENGIDETLTYIDSLPKNNTPYYYRVFGKTAFGISGPVSDTITVIGRPAPLDASPYLADILPINTTFKIKWEFPVALNTQINGFEIMRSRYRDDIPTKIATLTVATIREYTDNQPMPENYYTIVALDKNGYRLESLPKLAQLKDVQPPAAPIALNGSVDKFGTVTIKWAKNTELDLQGYRVFACNQIDGEYSEITRYWIKENGYNHETGLNTLAEKLYYKVCALDYHENQSELSAPLTLSILDILPPVRPVLVALTSKSKGVQIDWEISSSEDVVKHEIQRKATYGTDFTTIATIQNKGKFLKTYLDSLLTPLGFYDYRILATDDAGLTSVSYTQSSQAIGSGFRDNVTSLDAIYDVFSLQSQQNLPVKLNTGVGRNIVKISWYYDVQNDVQEYIIYRTVGPKNKGTGLITGRSVLWKTFTPNQALFNGQTALIDSNQGGISQAQIAKGTAYYLVEDNDMLIINKANIGELHYQVLVKYRDGTSSKIGPYVTAH